MNTAQRTDAPPPIGKVRPSQGSGQAKMPPRKTWLWLLLVLVANFLLVRTLMPSQDAAITVPYTLFKEQVTKGNVQAIYSRGERLTGRFAAAVTYPPPAKESAASGGHSPPARDGASRSAQPKTAKTFKTTI